MYTFVFMYYIHDLFNQPYIQFTMSSIIDRTLAKTLISGFQTQNAATGGPGLITPDGIPLNGYFVDRACLESILSNPDIVGVSVYIAKHPDYTDPSEKIFTLILSGAEPNPDYTETNGRAPYISKSGDWDQLVPCPPHCTELL